MYKSYLKIAWRNLLRTKGYSFINISGLAVGMTVAMLIGLWIWDELSFNRYFENRDRLAQVMVNQTHQGMTYTSSTVQVPLGDALRSGYSSDFTAMSLTSWNNRYVLSVGEQKMSTTGMWVQQEFPAMFSFKMLSGSIDALKDPSTILISHSLAESLFGDADPLNKAIRIDNKLDMVVGGVYEDLPYNTTFRDTKLLLPWNNSANSLNNQMDWTNHNGQLFVQLRADADPRVVNEKIKNVPTPHIEKWKEEAMLHSISKL